MGYPGSKGGNGVWQQIISQIPQCDLFIEAMAGSGILSKKLSAYSCSTVTNDIDRSLPTDLHLSYQDLIVKYDCIPGKKTVFYFDPPYLFETRKSKRQLYKFEWTVLDHQKFLSQVLTVKCDCMISHYPCNMYNHALQSWRTVRYQAATHNGARTECLYMNFPTPKILVAADIAGSDCWHRQAIKRKVTRLLSKIKSLPEHEQAALRTELKKAWDI